MFGEMKLTINGTEHTIQDISKYNLFAVAGNDEMQHNIDKLCEVVSTACTAYDKID